ncbi:aminoacylase-1A-like isoform X2 [Trichoplusia ni]|uniref:N-acyl-aliphatic-L-amino acid amidohydrolase n=1 Tax=Trichoplusia ni TaxID=7111 RepID=A0A7E5VVV3_TRINI|nr:aminoacylase-1A-like isoform X2 [Trichoplusia ni]
MSLLATPSFKMGEKMMTYIPILLAVLLGSQGQAKVADSDAVKLLQKYVQINTVTTSDLTKAVDFWKQLAAEDNLPISVHEYTPGYPVVIIKWAGTDDSLDSIMLNSHMDVVPAAMSDGWTYDPFSGHLDTNGDIYGRGTQDMKSVSIQYYMALRRLKANNIPLLRNVYMTLMPDEELGAENGMIPFLKSQEFLDMNVGLELDEGTSYPIPFIPVFYQDKVVWQIRVDCYGISAHGSTFPTTDSTATGKCNNVINRFFQFRDEQYALYGKAAQDNAGGYTSINLNRINAGTADNVIPSHVSLVFDMRLGNTVDTEEFDATLHKWISEAGENITLTYILKNQQSPATYTNTTTPYWTAITTAAASAGVIVAPILPPGSTDARHVRNAGYPAYGVSPMPSTELLLHSVNERLNKNTFTKGISFYEKVIKNLANVPGSATAQNPVAYLYKTAE